LAHEKYQGNGVLQHFELWQQSGTFIFKVLKNEG
jgi:hypothetical protein